MTTPAAQRLYEAQHLKEWEGRGYAVYNPHNKPIAELPVIYGFNNGGSPGWYSAQLLAEDGTGLGGHLCSSEAYMLHDLVILGGSRPDFHEDLQEHYPDGYRMDFVEHDDERLGAAYKLNQEQAPKEEAN
ncbi:MAG: hypothetical protein Q8P59_12540 [Dehalococcoidia bacterium]|nr:hypothetical protein [Dehalococcoidia bacterium]